MLLEITFDACFSPKLNFAPESRLEAKALSGHGEDSSIGVGIIADDNSPRIQ
jgi:hypothetical protein